MKKKEKMYVIIFDKHKKFKEIRILSESSDPFVVNPQSIGDSIYIYTQKEFAKLIESEMRHITSPCEMVDDSNDPLVNIGDQIILPDGSIGYIKSVKDGSTKYINIAKPLPVSNKGYLKYCKVPIGTCSDSSSAMPTEAGATDATKTLKKATEEYRSDGKATCTMTGGVDINPKIEINGAEVSKKIFDDFLKAGSK